MGQRNLATAEKTVISEVSCEDHIGDFEWQGIIHTSRGWNYQCSILQSCNGKATEFDVLDRACVNLVTGSFCTTTPDPTTRQLSSSFWPNEKWLCSTTFSTCWLLFVPKSGMPLEEASPWLNFGHPESRDKYIKHHCKGIQKLYDRANLCVQLEGMYVEN
jgi:hypothetical protein